MTATRTYLVTWAALLGLTALLALVSHLGATAALWGLLVITPLKAALVFTVFMHLLEEDLLPRVIMLVTLATLVIFFALLFADVAWRGAV